MQALISINLRESHSCVFSFSLGPKALNLLPTYETRREASCILALMGKSLTCAKICMLEDNVLEYQPRILSEGQEI